MLNRAASITIACLLAIAGALGATPRLGATLRFGAVHAAAEAAPTCCGGHCQCGDACQCAADKGPTSPEDESPALPERSRGERAPLVGVPVASIAAVTLSEPIDLGALPCASSELAAPPSCRLRLALVSRWTT
jgi:hypothetical protein